MQIWQFGSTQFFKTHYDPSFEGSNPHWHREQMVLFNTVSQLRQAKMAFEPDGQDVLLLFYDSIFRQVLLFVR